MHDHCRTNSPHHFETGSPVVDVYGIRGWVAESTALYALIRWEDGREVEVDQGDPRVTVSADGGVSWASFYLWNTAGPKPEERPFEEEPATETPDLKVA